MSNANRPILVNMISRLITNPRRQSLLNQTRRNQPRRHRTIQLSNSITTLASRQNPRLQMLVIRRREIPIRRLHIRKGHLPRINRRTRHTDTRRILHSRINMPVSNVKVNRIRRRHVRAILIRRMQLSQLNLSHMTLLSHFIMRISSQHVTLQHKVRRPKISMNNRLSTILIRITRRLLPSQMPLPIRLPNPPRPITRAHRPLTNPILRPRPQSLHTHILRLLSSNTRLINPTLRSRSNTALNPINRQQSNSTNLALNRRAYRILNRRNFNESHQHPNLGAHLPIA